MAKEQALARTDSADGATGAARVDIFQSPMWVKTFGMPSEDSEEDVQQLGGVWTVACVEEKTPVEGANRFAMLEDNLADMKLGRLALSCHFALELFAMWISA